ncbi:MAG: 2-hydroxychromene-2-carboxylate isomerase [Alphaproteobacteria bacterium HGW-Alphaproteobacteria-18]|nr:MAG: 2-hydroxychromene-2-carboxylate isomerase [Alphaproteobacteria bacterium HGW-Alphaproteobacteria-18]
MTKAAPIEFWFDFSSGYAYLAAQEIDALGQRAGRDILWRPFMLGAAFKVTGMRGLSATPMKSDYARHDWARIARRLGVAMRLPDGHPKIALAATRAFYWIEAHYPEGSAAFARAVFRDYYTGNLDTRDEDQIAGLGARLGLDAVALASGLRSPQIKRVTTEMSETALSQGVFGSPFFLVEGEAFWGWDRMAMMEEWLQTGGW